MITAKGAAKAAASPLLVGVGGRAAGLPPLAAGAGAAAPPPAGATSRQRVFDLPLSSFQSLLAQRGLPAYHAANVWRAALRHGATTFDAITTLPLSAREALGRSFTLRHGSVVSSSLSADGSRKLLVELPRPPRGADGGGGGGGGALSALLAALPAKAPAPPAAPAGGGAAAAAAARRVEAVLMPWSRGRRSTLCVSIQAGCSLSCSFCHTGAQRLGGNLTGGDVVEQVLLAGGAPSHVVFMGQGEPLLNLRAVKQAVGVLCAPEGLALPRRRVTVSTAGVAPVIRRLAEELPGVRLALSLHAPTDALRTRLMGVNATWPLAEVMDALAVFVRARLRQVAAGAAARKGPGGGGSQEEEEGEEEEEEEEEEGAEGGQGADSLLRTPPAGQRFNGARRVRVSFEYLLLHGVNDSPLHASQLLQLLRGWLPHGAAALHAHVNLIPFNAWPGAPGGYAAPAPAAVAAFAAALRAGGFAATVRRTRGGDMLGACGQLRSEAEGKRGKAENAL
jgi:adenine C2-methylase RlmN of 23S rRNA A2503 and tRNA A37